MNAVGKLGTFISRGVYTVSGPFHPFGGCVDIIVVEQQDGSFKSSPWYVRFGKFQGVLKTREKVVNICVNGSEADFHMYLDHKGEAYFLREVDEVEEGESVSNNSSSGDEEAEAPLRSPSCNFDAGNDKVLAKNNSQRAQFLRLVFGKRSRKEGDFGRGSELGRTDSLEQAEFAANLLEVKWSTNLDTEKPIVKDKPPKFCDPSALEGQVDTDARIDGASEEPGLANCVEVNDLGVSPVTIGEDVTENGEHEDSGDGVLSGMVGDDLRVPAVLQICPRKVSDEEGEVSDRRSVGEVSECSFSREDGEHTVQSFNYCELSESSIVRKGASSEQTLETMCIASGESGDFHIHSEVLRARTEAISEDTVVEHILEDYELEVPPVEGRCDYSEKIDPFCYGTDAYNVVVDELLVEPESYNQTNNTKQSLGSVGEVDSQDVSIISSFSNSFPQSEGDENTKAEDSRSALRPFSESPNNNVPTKETNISSSDDLEEEQLLFGDIDDFNIGEIQSTGSGFPVNAATEKFPEDIEDLNESIDKSDQSLSSPEEFSHESQLPGFEGTSGNFRVSSSPVAIVGAFKVVDAEAGRLAESLPNLRYKIDSFGADYVNSISHSLDSNSKILNWTLQSEDCPSSIKLDEDKEQQLVRELSDTKDGVETNKAEDLQSATAIEISLCKHLFYEGMGSDAASQAFDAEKLDFDKFSSLGPEVMKDDRLVVRINGSYFPWDVAAPMVLGTVSFGNAHMFEPKGKIAVDQVEKSVSGEPSNASMSPSGNWRLWPFSFRRSRSRKAMQSALSDVGISDAEIASEVRRGVVEPKVVKKTVRVLCPTSEQLASLNLKEGRNSVTFTFLTPMLGKQPVDARIYVWKWNTRIVISDVDGTITRSDVLGQFMPLVGVDWSHLGVAHLFSAIKENGYQMLFLSARAISQAYITRQFLFNLKQDGKALPDGPVVISPDGLFPSLYREVIRRAPHEFKIACLEKIRSLFPSDCNPFYAGFGNRDTDEVSYLKVGIPKGKIFIINPKGEVAVNRRVDTKSYKSIHALVNGMFPPTASSEQEDFNSWNFWKLPPPIVDE